MDRKHLIVAASLVTLVSAPARAQGRTVTPACPWTAVGPDPRCIEAREIYWGYADRRQHDTVLFKEGKPLEGAAFYRAVGRPDLVDAYARRQGMVGTVAVAGVLTLLTGVVLMVTNIPEPFVLGLAGILAAPAMWLSAAAIRADPLSPAERLLLARLYNQSLAPTPVHPTLRATRTAVDLGVRVSF
jgi:hypothetical protein